MHRVLRFCDTDQPCWYDILRDIKFSKFSTDMSHHTLAAVDLGSNSFHLQISRVVNGQLYPLDALKETVRLGAGVTAEKSVDPADRKSVV